MEWEKIIKACARGFVLMKTQLFVISDTELQVIVGSSQLLASSWFSQTALLSPFSPFSTDLFHQLETHPPSLKAAFLGTASPLPLL